MGDSAAECMLFQCRFVILSKGTSYIFFFYAPHRFVYGTSEAGVAAAPPGPALFALDGNRAFVYFPQSNQLMRWHDGVLKPMDFDIGGEILSLRAAHGRVEFAVRRDGEFWIVRSDGAVLGALTGAGAPVMLLKDGALFKAGDALIVRRDDGTELSFDLTGVESLLPMGAGYVQIRAGAAAYALCVEPEREQLFVLPEPLP